MGKGLDVPLVERLSLFSSYLIFMLSHTDTRTHTSSCVLAAENKDAPLIGEHCPSSGLVCQLYAQYQVAI